MYKKIVNGELKGLWLVFFFFGFLVILSDFLVIENLRGCIFGML